MLQIPIDQDLQLPPDISIPRINPPVTPLAPDTTRSQPPATVAAPSANDPYAKYGKYDVTRIGQRGIGNGVNMYSLERERDLGKALAQEVNRSTRFVSDEVVVNYINRLGQTIVRNSDARVPFTIRVVDNDEVNAFALPGGFFYINSGLILAANSEAALVGVMAHEIAHVAARHATKAYTRAQIYNLASIPLVFIGGPVTYALRQAMGIGAPLSIMKFSRDNEREADLLGIEYAYVCGYDPAELVHFFETLRLKEKQKKRNLIAKAFATHPMTDERVKRAQREIETMLPAKDAYIVTTSEFEQMKARLAKLENRETDARGNEVPTLRRRGPDVRSKDSKDEEKTSPGDERPRLHR
ncbi:MAG: M48 family metallopeptidase [Terriglobales bacterium]